MWYDRTLLEKIGRSVSHSVSRSHDLFSALQDQLLTGLTFSSKAARDLMRIFAPNKKKKKSRKVSDSVPLHCVLLHGLVVLCWANYYIL